MLSTKYVSKLFQLRKLQNLSTFDLFRTKNSNLIHCAQIFKRRRRLQYIQLSVQLVKLAASLFFCRTSLTQHNNQHGLAQLAWHCTALLCTVLSSSQNPGPGPVIFYPKFSSKCQSRLAIGLPLTNYHPHNLILFEFSLLF